MTIQKVLVVDDSKTELMYLTDLLQKQGLKVRTAENGDEAMQRLAEDKPDLILMDLHLPGVDGKRLTTLVRQQPGCQLLPIVFLTGEPDTDRQFEVLEAGADDYVTKPLTLDALSQVLDRVSPALT